MGVSFGLSRRDVASRSLRFSEVRSAVHEAGHAVVTEVLGHQVASVQVWPSGAGHEGVMRTTGELPADASVLISLAGRIAEQQWASRVNRSGVTDGPVTVFIEVATSASDDEITYEHLPASRFPSRSDAERAAKALVKRHFTTVLSRAESIAARCGCAPENNTKPDVSSSAAPQSPAQQQFSGGITVSSVDEIRGAMSLANERAGHVMGALQQALLDVEEIQQTVHTAADNSSHSSAQEAIGSFAKAQEAIGDLQGLINAGRDAAEQYAASL